MLHGQVSEPLGTAPKPGPEKSAADVAWFNLQAAMAVSKLPNNLPADPPARRAVLEAQAVRFTAAADRAKEFYTKHPEHPKASEARILEVRSLIGGARAGDATSEGRLNQAIDAIRSDKQLASAIKVQVVASHAFGRAMRGKKTKSERLQEIEQAARGLVAEFPDQPQGYESLMTVAVSMDDENKARQIADELVKSPAPAAIKENARALLGRIDLLGKSIEGELDAADTKSAKAVVREGLPTVIYTWATWSPGSVKLAAWLKNRGVNANVLALNLDEDVKSAEALAAKENLLGTPVYDDRGRDGALAQRLKIKSAPQVIIVDATGKIRDVRGEVDLDKKLTALGL